MDSTIPLLTKFKISSLYLSSGSLQPGLCQTWSETPKTGFHTARLNFGPSFFATTPVLIVVLGKKNQKHALNYLDSVKLYIKIIVRGLSALSAKNSSLGIWFTCQVFEVD